MIVLVVPMYSKQELNADSNYVVYTSLIRAMLSHRPSWHFVVTFPDAKSGYKYEDDGFFRLPNVTRLPQRIDARKMANAISYDQGFWDTLCTRFGFDVVWCNLVESAADIRMAGGGGFDVAGRMPVIAAHNYVIHKSLPYIWDAMRHVAVAQLRGALLADCNVFNSDHCQAMLMDNAREVLSPACCEEILAKSVRIDYGTLRADLAYQERDTAEPVIAYNHRLQGYKQFRETFELFDELQTMGLKFRVRYMSNCNENVTKISSYPWVEVKMAATYDQYIANLRGCDLNVTNSLHETFCIAAIESMALGQPLVAPDGVTFPEITGRATTGYPYLFKSREEQAKMVARLLTDVAERRKWGRVLSDYVRGAYNDGLWAERYAALFEKMAYREIKSQDDAREFFADTLAKHNGKTMNEFRIAIWSKPVNGRVPYGDQSMPLTKMVKYIRQVGGRVSMSGGQQYVWSS